MLTVQDDWIQYEAVPARRIAVRGGASCAVRPPTVRSRTAPTGLRPAAPMRPRVMVERREAAPLRLTMRGRLVLVVLPALLALSASLVVTSGAVVEAPGPVPAAVAGR